MTWQIDSAHSAVSFSIKHMLVTTMRGHFNKFYGQVVFNESDPVQSLIEAEADAASIDTRHADRDKYLRSESFFDVEQYPKLTFKSTHIASNTANDYHITGDLTIHGVSKPVTFEATYSGVFADLFGTPRVGVTASCKISRKDYGLVWNNLLENGNPIIGDEVTITLEIEIVDK